MSDVRIRVPLRLKLSLLITALLILTVVLLSAVLLHQAQSGLTNEMTKRGLTLAKDLGASARNAVLTNDGLTLNLLVEDAMKDGDVAYVVITDHHGKILAHSDVSLIGKRLDRPPELAPSADTLVVQTYRAPDGKHLTDFAVPLVFRKIRVGAVYLGFSRASIDTAMTRARNRTVVISVAMVLLGLGGALALAAILARPVLRLVDATRTIAAGDLTVSLAVPSRDEIGALTESFNRMAASLREKVMIKRAFERYVAREVVDELLKEPARLVLSGERREVSVLFCDVRGFTRLTEHLGAEKVVRLLNEFYELMIDAVSRHEGTLDKFLGDAVMAVFGAPVQQADHAIRAVRAAVAMQDGLARLNARRLIDGGAPLTVGIGISTGETVAGTVGTQDRMEYTVIGDSVNLAARLESRAKPMQIIICQRTYKGLDGLVDARPLGMLKVKGKAEQVEAYEVLGAAGSL